MTLKIGGGVDTMNREKLHIEGNSIEYVSISETIQSKLDRLGIDISKNDYMKNPNFAEFKKGFVAGNIEEGTVTEAWWVEKNLVGQKRLEEIYGPYWFGMQRKLSKEELDEKVWFEVLANRYPDKNRTYKDIWRYFYRDEGEDDDSKKGLIRRLEKLGFYINNFPDNQDKVKLLFFLYCFEIENNVQLSVFLGNPTLENVDNSFVGDETKNGALMSDLKRTIKREINPTYSRMVLTFLTNIGVSWEEQLKKIMVRVDYSLEGKYKDDLKRISKELQQNMYRNISGGEPLTEYEDTILETFYLKLSQHENLGREYDIIDVNSHRYKEDYTDYNPEYYKRLAYQAIKKSEVVNFLKDSKEELLPLVFEKDAVSSNERKRYDVIADLVENYIHFIDENTRAIEMDIVSKLYVVSYMQELLRIDKKDKIDNYYYRRKTSESKSLYTELSYGIDARRKSQIALIRRVNRRFYHYSGKAEEWEYAESAETYIDVFLCAILQSNSLNDMMTIYNLFMQISDNVLLLESQIEYSYNRLKKCANRKQKGYDWVISPELKRFFIGTIHNSPIIDQIGKGIGNAIFKAHVRKYGTSYDLDVALTNNYIARTDNYRLRGFIDYYEQRFIISSFKLVADPKLEKILARNCIRVKS